MDDFRQFQDLLCRVTGGLQIPEEEIQDSQHKLLNILHTSGPARIALLVNEAIMELARTVWHPITGTSAPQWAERHYVLAKGSEFLFSHPAPNSLLVQAALERSRKQHPRSTPKESKCLDLLGRKVFSSSGVQFRIANIK